MRRYDEDLEGPLTPLEYFEAVIKRQMGFGAKMVRCPVSQQLFYPSQMVVHHPYEKWMLRRDRLFEMVWDPRNGIAVSPIVHANHHRGFKRIPGYVLDPLVFEFAAELGPAAVELVRKNHP